MAAEDDFADFVRARAPALYRYGFVLTGNPHDADDLVQEALTVFFDVREVPGLKKKPSTSELLDWLKLLMVEDISVETLRERDPKRLIPPLHGALLKNEQDAHLFERWLL